MGFEDLLRQVWPIGDIECSEYRILLALCISVMVVLACIIPFLLRGDSSSDNRSCGDARDDLNEAARAQERWQNQDWQSKVHQSSQVRRERGIVVLVTGAAGFVGLHSCLALKNRGDGVVGLDNMSNASDLALKRERLELLEKSSVFVIRGDINDAILLRKLFDMIHFTHVLHLAAQPSIRNSTENPGAYVQSNIAGLVTLLEACRKATPQPAFVWTSSSSVYGLNSSAPSSESDRSDQPTSLYAASKQAGEGLVHVYNHTYGLSTTTLRLGTVYGPWGRPDMAYWIFARDILRGKEITIYEGPNQADLVRDWTFIDDIVQGCVAAVDTAQQSTGSGGRKSSPAQFRTFNLGCPSPVTIVNLLNILEELLEVKAKIRVVEMPNYGSAPFMYADISLARSQLGYHPTTDPYTGLKRFVDWYLDYHGLTEFGCS
ncbi:unnamed protein product [Calypogeia fissa]